MEYPLKLKFKIWTFVPQIYIEDATGKQQLYMRQKLFKLKEQVSVYSDSDKTNLLYNLNADRVIDFSPKYHITDVNGSPICDVKRHGMRSLWKTDYDILMQDKAVFKIREENPWTKFFDTLMTEIPIIGLFAGYFFNPTYIIKRVDDSGHSQMPVIRIKKQPSFLESNFIVEKVGELSQGEENELLVSSLLMVLLERARG